MQFQALLTAQGGLGTGISNLGIAAVIAALACLLCAEIVCIVILIRKIIRAKNATLENSSYRNHYGVAIIGLTAIPKASFLAITVLAWLTALGALVFAILLIVCRAKGYDFAVVSKIEEEDDEDKPEPREDIPTQALVHEQTPEEIYSAQYVAASVAEETPFAVFDAVEPVAEQEEPVAKEPEEEIIAEDTTVEEAPTEEIFPDEEPVEEIAEEETTAQETPAEVLPPVVADPTPAVVTSASDAPIAADGTQPYKVVEKIVTETYKEVVKETPVVVSVPAEQTSAADAVLTKLSDLLDYELQKRKEQDKAKAEAKNAEEEESKAQDVPVINDAPDAEDAEDEDDADEDEDEAIDADDPRDEDDIDDENEGDLFTGNERIIGMDEETGCYIVAHYRKSFEAKLIQARPHIKKYYSEIKNALLSYSGTKSRISWACETFSNERQSIVKINARGRVLELYLALDPASLEGSVYHGKDVGYKKKYADTPFQYKLRTPRKFKWAMELIQQVCEEQGLSPIDIEHVDYVAQYAFDTTENLVSRGLIREYARMEKPATSFELDPDHIPATPEEDGSVIPANANFSWEFDNDAMAEKPIEEAPAEEAPVEEEPVGVASVEDTVAEEAPAVEDAATEDKPEEAPVQPVETVRETVKVTEMRYTERYYANGEPVYEQVITTGEPVVTDTVSLGEPTKAPAEDAIPLDEQENAEQIVVVEPKQTTVVTPAQEEEYFFASEEDQSGFSADKFDGADPFADFRGEDEPMPLDEEEVIEDEPYEEAVISEEEPNGQEEENDGEEASPEEELFFEEPTEDSPEEIAVIAPVEVSVPTEAPFCDDDEQEASEEENFEEEYTEEEYAEEEYSEEEYTEEEYTEEEYSDEEYAEEEYTEEEYAEEEYYEYDEDEYYEEPYDGEEEYYDEEDYTEESYEADELEDGYYEDEDDEDDAYAQDFVYSTSKAPIRQISELSVPQSSRPAPAANPSAAVVDLCAVEGYFEEDSTVNLYTLKEMGLIVSSATSLKITCSGSISKKLRVEANMFTHSAIHAIHEVGGEMDIIR